MQAVYLWPYALLALPRTRPAYLQHREALVAVVQAVRCALNCGYCGLWAWSGKVALLWQASIPTEGGDLRSGRHSVLQPCQATTDRYALCCTRLAPCCWSATVPTQGARWREWLTAIAMPPTAGVLPPAAKKRLHLYRPRNPVHLRRPAGLCGALPLQALHLARAHRPARPDVLPASDAAGAAGRAPDRCRAHVPSALPPALI
jgi:hypothetical protein